MILNKLSLQSFRNYAKSEFTFSPEVNLIVGSNAAGKTNILEAIYFLASGRSFRVKGVEREAIRYNEEIGRINGIVSEVSKVSKGDCDLGIVLTAGEILGEKTAKKRYFVNGVGKRQLDFLGNLRAVYFGPEDLELVTDSPSLRRKYLDMVLSQTDREYARASLSYEKGLRQRNKILESFRLQTTDYRLQYKNAEPDRRRLYFWDQLLVKNGNYITKKREEFINCLPSTDYGLQQFSIEYDKSTISEERLVKYSVEEMAAGVTLVGPHRDDFKFRIDDDRENKGNKDNQGERGRDLAVYGSRGEQRLAILWLKLGELAYITQKTNETSAFAKASADKPVLLLDDIFSELDVSHRKLVFDLIGKYQTIMTTADIGMVEKEWIAGVRVVTLGP